MKRKTLIISIVAGLSAFGLGWFFNDMSKFADGVKDEYIKADSLQKDKPKFATIRQDELDCLMVFNNIYNKTENFSTKISGKYLLKGANCAGLNFISKNLATWTNEIDCGHPDTLQLRWLDNATFYTQDIIRLNEECPPRVWIYQVVSFDGIHLILKDIWTGWGFTTKADKNPADERMELIKQTDKQ